MRVEPLFGAIETQVAGNVSGTERAFRVGTATTAYTHSPVGLRGVVLVKPSTEK